MTLEKFRSMPPHKQDEYTQHPDCPVAIKVEYLDDGDCDFDRDEVTNIISAVVNQSCDFAAYCDGRRIISAASLRLSKAKCPPLKKNDARAKIDSVQETEATDGIFCM